MKAQATFGVWVSEDGAHYSFVRWIKDNEVDPHSTLEQAAAWYLHVDAPQAGRYMIQSFYRGSTGEAIQALTFDAEPVVVNPRLRVVPTTTA